MATVTVRIKDGKAVGCVGAKSGFISIDGTLVIADGWCVQVRSGRIICDTKHRSFFETDPLFHRDFPLYFQNGELFLTESSFGKRNTYFFGSVSQENTQQSIYAKEEIGV